MATSLQIAIIGCGAIGSLLARYCTENSDEFHLVSLCDNDAERYNRLVADLGISVPRLSIADSLAKADLVIEAAIAEVVPGLVLAAIAARTDIMLMSVGGLILDADTLPKLEASTISVYLPSGAIAGVDAIRAARHSGIQSVELITRKPTSGLRDAPYILEQGIDLDALTTETEIFSGSAREAIAAFPRNVNVAAVVSLAGIGFERTRVRVLSGPELTSNSHEIVVVAASGRIVTRTDNLPAPQNPKTSYLAALSAQALLLRLASSLVVGS